MILRYTVSWIGMVIIAIMNGVIRDAVYGKSLGELTAHQVSTITLIILSGLYLWLLGLTWNITSPGQAITIGLIWLALTVAFEFLFGHYIMKHSWTRLLHDYNILKGRIWILVLIWITIAPYVFYKFRS
jgi:hypothetical protein